MQGNNGKSILLYIIKLILDELATNTKPQQLNNDFNQNLLNNKHGVLFDETKGYSFKNTEDYLKKLTGGGTIEKTRKIQTNEIIETRLNSHVFIATNELPNFNLNDTALFSRISVIKLPNRFSYSSNEINDKTIFPINDNIRKELKEDKNGLEHFIYDCIKEYRLMKDKNELFINKRGIEYVRAFYLGNDPLINFLSVYIELTDYETEDTTNQEILNNFKEYTKDNNIDYIITEERISKDIGMKLNKLYGKENIIRHDNVRPMEYKNIKCIYTTGTEIEYIIDPNLEDYEITNKPSRKIFNLIRKGYNTFELLKQQEKEHNKILKAIQYLKEIEYIQEEIILKTNQ